LRPLTRIWAMVDKLPGAARVLVNPEVIDHAVEAGFEQLEETRSPVTPRSCLATAKTTTELALEQSVECSGPSVFSEANRILRDLAGATWDRAGRAGKIAGVRRPCPEPMMNWPEATADRG